MQSFECRELGTYFYTITASMVIGFIQLLLNQNWFHSFCLRKSSLKARRAHGVLPRQSGPDHGPEQSLAWIYRGKGLTMTLQWNRHLVTGECKKQTNKQQVSPHANLFDLEKLRYFYCCYVILTDPSITNC